MARTEPMLRADPKPVGNKIPVVPMARGAYPQGPRIQNRLDDQEEIAYILEQLKRNDLSKAERDRLGRDLKALHDKSAYSGYYKPNWNPRQRKETSLDDIANILLAIAGYGTIVPGPYGIAYKTVARTGRRYVRNRYSNARSR